MNIDSAQLRQDLQVFLKSRPDLSCVSIAQHTTLPGVTVRSFLNGHELGGERVHSELYRVLSQARAGDILQPGAPEAIFLSEDGEQKVRQVRKLGNFYSTQTVRKVAEVLDYCAENHAIGVITADFGVGKTEAVKHWRKKSRSVDSMVFEFDEFTASNKFEMVRMIAEACGISLPNRNAGSLFRAICAQLRQEPCLLIFDQCEMVRPRGCQILRQLWDRTADAGVGLVMLAAPIMLSRMSGGKMADMGALTSRVGIWAPLSGITRNEMAAVVKAEGFLEVDQAAFDLWYKATGGSMRRLTRSLDLLRSRHAAKRITEKTIVGVAGMLWGMNIDRGDTE